MKLKITSISCNFSAALVSDTHCQSSLQFASDCAETVEHKVLPNTVDPFTAGGEGTADKVTTFSLTGAEASDNLDHTTPQDKNKIRITNGSSLYRSLNICKTAFKNDIFGELALCRWKPLPVVPVRHGCQFMSLLLHC